MIFFLSFLAVSGLVFTGCFICLIYVPCPDCCMGPACSSHMAVPHALMRCPISRNTNWVLRPSLWLYDVWTHKSFPQIPDQDRSQPDQAMGCSTYFWGGLFSVTWVTLEQYIKRELAKLRGLEVLSTFSDSAFYFLAGNFTASQYWLRLHTGIEFVAFYNELIEHQEVLETIRASYNSVDRQLIAHLMLIAPRPIIPSVPMCVQSKAVDSCATFWFWLLSLFLLFRPSVSFARSENLGKFLSNIQFCHVSVRQANKPYPTINARAAKQFPTDITQHSHGFGLLHSHTDSTAQRQ